mmetsp:Transcript_974/g.2363  ORF Transcript_974/g.2363 Transcript_974/m.2363 type:complete len:204 (+) Transcript_974:47-658(+)
MPSSFMRRSQVQPSVHRRSASTPLSTIMTATIVGTCSVVYDTPTSSLIQHRMETTPKVMRLHGMHAQPPKHVKPRGAGCVCRMTRRASHVKTMSTPTKSLSNRSNLTALRKPMLLSATTCTNMPNTVHTAINTFMTKTAFPKHCNLASRFALRCTMPLAPSTSKLCIIGGVVRSNADLQKVPVHNKTDCEWTAVQSASPTAAA